MIELPSAFAESGTYPPDRELPGFPRQCSLPLACSHPPEAHQIGARKRRTPGNTIISQPYHRRVSTDRLNREGSQWLYLSRVSPALHPPERPSHTPHTPKPGFGGRGYDSITAGFSPTLYCRPWGDVLSLQPMIPPKISVLIFFPHVRW